MYRTRTIIPGILYAVKRFSCTPWQFVFASCKTIAMCKTLPRIRYY